MACEAVVCEQMETHQSYCVRSFTTLTSDQVKDCLERYIHIAKDSKREPRSVITLSANN